MWNGVSLLRFMAAAKLRSHELETLLYANLTDTASFHRGMLHVSL